MAEAEEKKEKKDSQVAKKTGTFWKGVKAEFKKIIWPDRKTLYRDHGRTDCRSGQSAAVRDQFPGQINGGQEWPIMNKKSRIGMWLTLIPDMRRK